MASLATSPSNNNNNVVDTNTIAAALQNTFNPNKQLRLSAEQFLKDTVFTPGFFPQLLQFIVAHPQPHIRLAGAIHLKNSIKKHWSVLPPIDADSHERMLRSAMQKIEEQQGVPKAQQLNEGDKNMLRENIFEAAVPSPTRTRA